MKNKVFIVEDNKDIGFILDYFLSEEGFDVSIFPTVAEFNHAFNNQLPDIFLLDVMLPDGDGISLCNNIKHDRRAMEIPVLMMSAHVNHDKILSETGADDFIGKPFDLYAMLDRINTHLHPNC